MVNYTPKFKERSKEIESVYVKDIMTSNFKSLTKDQDISDAIKLLLDNKLSGIVVLDEDGGRKAEGFLSVKDCLKLGLDMKYHNEPPNKVHEYMTTEVTSISEDADIFDLIELFTEHHFRIAPVVDEFKNVVGIVDRQITLRALDRMYQTTWQL